MFFQNHQFLTILHRTHVTSDLRPYVCTVEECDRPQQQFATVKDYDRHERANHDFQSEIVKHVVQGHRSLVDLLMHPARYRRDKCPFCDQVTAAATGRNSREGHVGRHMEEIAFLVVPKLYEDWDFYSDSSSSGL